MHPRSRFGAIGFFSVLVIGTALLAAPAQATVGGGIGLIAYHGNRAGNLEIYTVNPSSAATARLTFNSASDTEPSWSPDGKKIAFVSNRDGNLEIYTMNADGSGQTRVTNNAAFDEFPSWSPDGTKIVFDSGRDDPPGPTRGEIYTMNPDGTGVVRLTNDPNYDFAPDWSPDGTRIAWTTTRTGNSEIFRMNTDGTSPVNMTNRPTTAERNPNWSPDGTKIAFDQDDSGSLESATMNADGTNFAYLWIGFAPTWRPDGAKLAYTEGFSHTSTDTDITVVDYGDNLDTNLTHERVDGYYAAYPDWQPINSNYPRPQSGSPMRIPIVPDFKACPSAQTSHRGTISAPSCYNPTPESSYLTIGSPEYNGAAASSSGYTRFKVNPDDVSITVELTDVRCRGTSGGCSNGALSDYSGHLLFSTNFRITDKNNGPTGVGLSRNGTVQSPVQVYFPVPCQTTPSTSIGSTCSVTTSIDTVLGGSSAITAGRRAIWQLVGYPNGKVIELDDGGADGIGTTWDNTTYAAGGLFVP